MGKRIISQRRGRGSPTYRSPRTTSRHTIDYDRENRRGRIVDLVNDPGRNPPVAKILYASGDKGFLIAPKGIRVGDVADFVGKLRDFPVGSQIFGIESSPNSGPKFCRTSGCFATISNKTDNSVTVQFPSKKIKTLHPECRASLGAPAGDGHKEKPWLKAGKKYIAMHRRGKLYPRTCGSRMNAVDHPFGGPTKPGKPKTVSRHAPPGAKVGSWGARRTGRRKK